MAQSRIEVILPTLSKPTRKQRVIGKSSAVLVELEEFRGIPFGIVPGRWQHSVLREELPSDRFEALKNGPKCPQPSEPNNSDTFQCHVDFPSDVTESEFECLNLFIVRPSSKVLKLIHHKSDQQLPVLVWIHGGGYAFGAGTDPMWDPSRLVLRSLQLHKPIIAVCLNYRLNVFGFGASSEMIQAQSGLGVRGCNFGLRDQKVGLMWVSHNIKYFGGDASKVSIAGQSAGGCSVHVHTLEAKTKPQLPLFRKAIIQSGAIGCLGPITIEQADWHWDTLCDQLRVPSDGTKSRLESISIVPAAELLKAISALKWFSYALVIDNLSMTASSDRKMFAFNFDTSDGLSHCSMANAKHIQVMIGDMEAEASVFKQPMSQTQTFAQVRSLFCEAYESSEIGDKLLEAYQITESSEAGQLGVHTGRFITDVIFGYPVFNARNSLTLSQPAHFLEASSEIENRSAATNYHFTDVQAFRMKFGNPFPGPSQGVAHHCAELIYIFDAFHDDLIRIDSQSSSFAMACISSDRSTTFDRREKIEPRNSYVSNIALRNDLQNRWISFIADNNQDTHELQLKGKCGSEITVFDEHRRAKVENLECDSEWVQQRSRFELLASYPKGSKEALKKIVGMVLI